MQPLKRRPHSLLWFLGICLSMIAALGQSGEALYHTHCASCHGAAGEGVFGEYEFPLTGDDSVEELAAVIHRTMPDDEPREVRGADADAIAAYMYKTFYSRQAWQRLHPTPIAAWPLDAESHAIMKADRAGRAWPGAQRGFRRSQEAGGAVQTGGLLVPDTGEYAFVLRGAGKFRMWLNDLETPLLDSARPAPRGRPQERHASIRLLGGTAYPIRIEHTEPVELIWRPPFGAERVIPHDRRCPDTLPPVRLEFGLEARGRFDPREASPEARLAFALWGSIADTAFSGDAAAMLRHPRGQFQMRRFFIDWLQVDAQAIAKSSERYAMFDSALREDLRESLLQGWEHLLWSEGADYRQLFLGGPVMTSPSMTSIYGPSLERYSAGLLTHPYLLAAQAFSSNSSPIHRGVFITRKLFGRRLQSPHPSISILGDVVAVAEFAPDLTMREKTHELTKARDCQTCHSVINPLGFALEQFDAIGRFRERDQDGIIDPSGFYETRDGDRLPFAGPSDLATFAADDEQAQRAFVERLFRFLTKQDIRAYGYAALDDLQEQFETSNYNIRYLAIAIARHFAN
jgi:hypothetical protein